MSQWCLKGMNNLSLDWAHDESTFRWTSSFATALLFHVPLFWISVSFHKPPLVVKNVDIPIEDVIPEFDITPPQIKISHSQPKAPLSSPESTLQERMKTLAQHSRPTLTPVNMRPALDGTSLKIPATSLAPEIQSLHDPKGPAPLIADRGTFHSIENKPIVMADKGRLNIPLQNTIASVESDSRAHGPTLISKGTEPASIRSNSAFEMTGLKDRAIERQVIPEYPESARSEGIRGGVTLEFTVLPNGTIKDSILVRRTSGYVRLDQSSIQALRQWKFAALASAEQRNEVGTITFYYSLR